MKYGVSRTDAKTSHTLAILTFCAFFVLLFTLDCRCQATERTVKVNKEFTISLKSNPSTGYKWALSFDKAFLKLKADRFNRPTKALIGAGGTQTFVLLPVREGETEVHLVYKRSWEKIIARERTYRLHITR